MSAGGLGLFAGDVVGAKMAGADSIAMVGLGVSGGEAQAQLVEAVANGVGMKFKGYTALPTDSSDLSPAVKAAEETGADVILMGLDKVNARQFMVA